MKPLSYLLIDLACISVPFLFSFHPKFPFYKTWRSFFKANIIVAIFFLIWDYIFTEHGVWGFNPNYLTGIYIANLPIEEVIFFICIPYACVFTYFALKSLIKKSPPSIIQKSLTFLLMFMMLVLAFRNSEMMYTLTTTLFVFAFLLYTTYRQIDLSFTYIAYILILPFFFISNGVLTGSFVDSPIVWYNNDENMSLRMFTIPFEDIFYGFLLIGLNIQLYVYFNKRLT